MNEQNNGSQNNEQQTNNIGQQNGTNVVSNEPRIEPLPVPNVTQQKEEMVTPTQVEQSPQTPVSQPGDVQNTSPGGEQTVTTQPNITQDMVVAPQQEGNGGQQVTQEGTNIISHSEVTTAPMTNNQVMQGFGQTNVDNSNLMPQVPNMNTLSPTIPNINGNDSTQVGFVAASSDIPKKKNVPLIVAIVIILLGILGGLGYYVGYPFVLRTFFYKPINVYNTSINEFYKGFNNITMDILHTKAIYEANISIESNLEAFKEFSGFSYGINLGVDPKKELIQMGYQITNLDNGNEYSYFDYVKNGKEYVKYSNNRGYIYMGEVNLENSTKFFSTYNDLLLNSEKLKSEDINYLIDKIRDLTKETIKEDRLSREDTTITVKGETVKVTNNKYSIDKSVIKDTKEYIVNGILSDAKAMEILSSLLDMENKDLKSTLEEMKNADIDIKDEVTYTFSIYTFGNKSEIIGFGLLSSDNSMEVQYYNMNGYFEFNTKTESYNDITGKLDENTFSIIGRDEGGRTNISIKNNGTEILLLVVTEWKSEKKSLSYTLNYEEYKVTGKIDSIYDINNDRIKYSLTADANTSDEFVKIIVNINEDWTSDVANINTDNAITLEDDAFEKVVNEYNTLLMETPIGSLFRTINGEFSLGIADYYNGSLDFPAFDFEDDIINDNIYNIEDYIEDNLYIE